MKVLATSIILIAATWLIVGSTSNSPFVRELERVIRVKSAEITSLKAELADVKIAQEPIRIFSEYGYVGKNNPYARNPKYLAEVWSYCKKWERLLNAAGERSCRRENIAPEAFAFCWPGKETHYNPKEVKLNTDGTKDYNLTQINSGKNDEDWNRLYSRLPKKLKAKKCDPKTDPEIGIAMLYLWINERAERGQSWAYLKDWTWELYARIRALQG